MQLQLGQIPLSQLLLRKLGVQCCVVIKIIFMCGLLSSCVHANPWERQYHAKPEMSFTPDPLEQKMSDHVDQSKEMSGAVSAGSGGGCGCY